MQKATYILCIMAVVTSCKKELPPLPSTGTQGTFCWEQLVNNGYDPTNEWFADTSNFGPCPTQDYIERQLNSRVFNPKFAANNPNVIYFIERKCPDNDYPCSGGFVYELIKYDVCSSHKATVYSDFDNNNHYEIVVGDEGQILHKKNLFSVPGDNQFKYSFVYTNDDFSTIIEDTAFYKGFNHSYNSLFSQQDVTVYNQMDLSNNSEYMLEYDVSNNNIDTIHSLSNYLFHQIHTNDLWIIAEEIQSSSLVNFSKYDVVLDQITPIQGLQGINKNLSYSVNYSTINSYLNYSSELVSIDNSSGNSQVIFDAESQNISIENFFDVSSDGNYIIYTVNHNYWVNNCSRDFKYYLLIYNLQTGNWKAIDFAQ